MYDGAHDSLLLEIAALVNGRLEALAEIFLADALRNDETRLRFAELLGARTKALHWPSVSVMRQETSEAREGRHDLVLEDRKGNRLHIELKGYADFTRRQALALSRKPTKNDDLRIDVVIVPQPKLIEAHNDIVKLSWAQVENVMGPMHRGFKRLWLGETRIEADVLRDEMEVFARYRRKPYPEASWWYLWQGINVLKGVLHELESGKSDGPHAGEHYWYYGASFWAGEHWVWIGWVYLRDKRDLRLIVEDRQELLDGSSTGLRDHGFQVHRSVELWPAAGRTPDIIDLDRVGREARELLRTAPAFKALLP